MLVFIEVKKLKLPPNLFIGILKLLYKLNYDTSIDFIVYLHRQLTLYNDITSLF